MAVQAGKAFVLDEIDFPVVAHATSQTFKPIYYRGEAAPAHVGTYHPTLYINSLAAFTKIFGYNEISVRFFGVFCTLISAYLLLLILRLLIKKNEAAEILFLGLFLLNPYTIANTTLPDIDSTVLPVVLLLFIYLALRYLLKKHDLSNKAAWILGGLFGLTLWSKLTTPLIIPFFLVGLAFITSKNYKQSLLFVLKVTIIGSLAFALTYFAYCKALGISPTYTYHFLLDSFTKGTSSAGPLAGAINNLKNFRSLVYWFTLPLVGLLGISFLGVMFDNEKSQQAKTKKLLLALGALVTIFYIALIPPFGGFFKYAFPAFGLLLLGAAFFYDRYFRNLKFNWILALNAALLGFVIEKVVWKDKMFLSGKPFAYLLLLSLIIVAAFFLLKKIARPLGASLMVLLIFFGLGFQLSISRIQAISPYSTKYDYGQLGLSQTVAYLKSNTDPNEVIWSMKDVGYYVNNRYYESYSYYFNKSLEPDLINMLKAGKVRYYVATSGIGEDNLTAYPDIQHILDDNALKEKQFGDFVIYKAKSDLVHAQK